MGMRRRYWLFGLALCTAGALLLLTNSSIQDVGLLMLLIGTLFTIWHKLGNLEERIENLCSEIKKHLSRIERLEQWREESSRKQ
jgi:uncharacterized membrane protein